jgi:hypothetical protein
MIIKCLAPELTACRMGSRPGRGRQAGRDRGWETRGLALLKHGLVQDMVNQSLSQVNRFLLFFKFNFIILLYWRYTVTFTNVLMVYLS